MLNNATEEITRRIAEHEDTLIRRAILATDWSETAVLRILTYRPDPMDLHDPEDGFKIVTPEYDVIRYEDHAPPPSEHADGTRRVEVSTITWPLLERLADEYDDVAELVDVALGPDTTK